VEPLCVAQGTHYLETSNVGNSYGAFWKDKSRPVPPETIEARGNLRPHRLHHPGRPQRPGTRGAHPCPLLDDSGNPLPYIASNDITVFSAFDTGTGTISSYYFDTRSPTPRW
jgi:hypothetical protein